MENPWKVELYRSWDEVDSPGFAEQWRHWMEHAPDAHVFYHPAILKAWTDTYRLLQDISPLYCVARKKDITVFLPLVLWRRNYKNAFLRLLVPAGFSDYDYHDPLICGQATEEDIASFWEVVEKTVFDHKTIIYDEISLSGMRFSGKSDKWCTEEDVSPYLELSEHKDYRHFLSSLKGGLRQDLGRRERRMAENGSLEFHCYGISEQNEALQALPVFLDAHRQRWPNAYKANDLHKNILVYGLSEGVVHFSELRYNDTPISWHFGFLFKSRFYHYMPASSHDEKYRNFSPGKIHLSYLIRESISGEVKRFDFLKGAHPYKNEWTNLKMGLFRFSYKSRKLNSMLRLVAYNSLALLREHLDFLVM